MEITAYLCPGGFDCSGFELTSYMLPDGKDPVDCLLCVPACDDPYRDVNDLEGFNLDMLGKINQARITHPFECPPENCKMLKLNDKIISAARWLAIDMIYYDYFSSLDRLERPPYQRLKAFGVDMDIYGESIVSLEYTDKQVSLDMVAQQFLTVWMGEDKDRINVMDNSFALAGFGYANKIWIDEQGRRHEKYVGVMDLIDGKKMEEEFATPAPVLNCYGECVQKIRWEQKYSVIETAGGIKKIPEPYLITRVEIPQICALFKLVFIFELSACNAQWLFPTAGQEIPEDGKLSFTWQKYAEDERYWKHEWSLQANCFVPGEWLAVYAYLKSYESPCNPFLLAWGWFETQCWTSGILQGCGLLDENGDIKDGGPGYEFSDNWIGDEGLHWYVEFKGNHYWLKSSDFAAYTIGSRCYIYKNGLSKFSDTQNNVIEEPACRWPYAAVGNIPDEDSILSDSNVAYSLDREKDVIVPQTFYTG